MRSKSLRKKSFRRRSKSNKIRSKKRQQRGGKKIGFTVANYPMVSSRSLCLFGSEKCKNERQKTDTYHTSLMAKNLLEILVAKPNRNAIKNKTSDAEKLLASRDSWISMARSQAPAYIHRYCDIKCNTKNKKKRQELLETIVQKFGNYFNIYVKNWDTSAKNYAKLKNDVQNVVQKAENVLKSNGFPAANIGYQKVYDKVDKISAEIPDNQLKWWGKNEKESWRIRKATIHGWKEEKPGNSSLGVEIVWYPSSSSFYGPLNLPWGESKKDKDGFLSFITGRGQAQIKDTLDGLEQGLKKAKGVASGPVVAPVVAPAAGPAVGGRKRSRKRGRKKSKKRENKRSKKKGRRKSKKRNY
tara:strand:+ start:100 stop:1167 length:1068 start_codon:yes stop_codon:yes gene_type:complete